MALSNTFVDINCGTIFHGHSPPADLRRVVFSYKQKYVHNLLVNCLVKLAQEKSVR